MNLFAFHWLRRLQVLYVYITVYMYVTVHALKVYIGGMEEWIPVKIEYKIYTGVLSPTRLKKKTIKRSPFFVRREGHCCRGDLVGRTTF